MRQSSATKRRERWIAEQIAGAESFTVVTFLGYPDGYDVRPAASLDEARQLRRSVLVEYADVNYGRGACIYAITPSGMTVHVE